MKLVLKGDILSALLTSLVERNRPCLVSYQPCVWRSQQQLWGYHASHWKTQSRCCSKSRKDHGTSGERNAKDLSVQWLKAGKILFFLSSCSDSKVHKTAQHPHHNYHHANAHLGHQYLWRHAHMGCVQTHERKIEEEWFRGIVVPDHFARFLAEKITKIR